MSDKIPIEEMVFSKKGERFEHKNCTIKPYNNIGYVTHKCWGCERRLDKKAIFLIKIWEFNYFRK